MQSLVSEALAPVLRALGRPDEGAQAAEGPSRHGLPELSYPSPFVVKNTFLDGAVERPPSLEGFFLERTVQSCPASGVEDAACGGRRDAPLLGDKLLARAPRGLEQDGSARSRSTSAGSSSPGYPTEASEASDEGDTPASSPLAELPEFDYPAPLFVKNTFLDFGLGRPVSLEGFLCPRELHSCPASYLGEPGACEGEAGEADEVVACTTVEACSEARWPLAGLPPPPPEPPVLPPAARLPAAAPAEPPAAAAPAPVLLLCTALPPALGSPEMPTLGSAAHGLGCSPCAHAHSSKGCRNGAQCAFCHLCPPGELKRQQKAKRLAQRAEGRAAGHARAPVADAAARA